MNSSPAGPMRYKPTPLNLSSTALIGWSIWTYDSKNDAEGWGTLALFIFVGAGLLGLIVDFFIQKFVKKYWKIFAIEIVTLSSLLLYDSWAQRTKILLIPDNFDGKYIVTIYNVDNAVKLPKNFLSWSYRIKIPENGILLTSSDFEDDLPQTKMTTYSGIELNSKFTEKGFIRFIDDTIKCECKTYRYKSWMIDSIACCGYSSKEVDSFKINLQKYFCAQKPCK